MKRIRIATRASKLALAQTNQIKEKLAEIAPDFEISLVEISTKGDRDKSDFLYKSSSVGFFTSEVERALLDGRADVAVHSLKDLPTSITEGLTIPAIPRREQPNDTIVTLNRISSLADLPKGATIGTSSLRRIAQLNLLRPDLNSQPLRGNVETRIKKVTDSQVDAIVIAQAGLNRLGLSNTASLILDAKEFIPSPGQGALAIQTRKDDLELRSIVSKLDDPNTRIAVETERRILAGLHGGCSIPLGVYSEITDQTMHISAILCNVSATKHIHKTISCPVEKSFQAADQIIEQIFKEDGQELLDQINLEKNR